MPRKRSPENQGLPARWVQKHGAYYYLVPPALRDRWDGKSWFPLGDSLPAAHRTWKARVDGPTTVTTIGALLDRYLLEVVPAKAPKTQTENHRHVAKLRGVFGAVGINDMEPQFVYQYVDQRTTPQGKPAKVAAHREVEVLSHAFTKAVQWGLIKAHPFKGEVRLEGETPRIRYVEDWEILEVLALPSRRKKGSVGMIQAYLRLKLLTGLRQRDLLLLTVSDCEDDGLHVTPSKTTSSTGKRLIYEWTPKLRAAIEAAKDVRPALSPFLFCNRFGVGFVDETRGDAKDWSNMWQKFMARVLRETKITERFTEHDLRAKVGSDAESLERAQQLLAHADAATTKRVYRRKPERIKPAGSPLTPFS
jgi:integrase